MRAILWWSEPFAAYSSSAYPETQEAGRQGLPSTRERRYGFVTCASWDVQEVFAKNRAVGSVRFVGLILNGCFVAEAGQYIRGVLVG